MTSNNIYSFNVKYYLPTLQWLFDKNKWVKNVYVWFLFIHEAAHILFHFKEPKKKFITNFITLNVKYNLYTLQGSCNTNKYYS